ncbi:carbonic anhydrase [Actinoplanes sp. SE50]|uniref:carbonic anhydrase n=1 Tax=unclassified Actinoplanes TaxID=2626549 RepID=UPI00023EC057|nr:MULTISPECIES: carbonic anhydrase [unclassified Actinoplanes]AEV82414.1 Carbonic anhydrase [Actinoplanes sp. SE50/110]ATO80811.1 carbonic anhydrase [Actinoplanes sp. SE50]SLL98219.1 carbonic anhydrase [Actinoplanes sp. SE50/110]
MTATLPAPVTPAAALDELLAGNKRFVSGTPLAGHDVAQAVALAGGQQPHSIVLGCIDSRVPLEAVFDQAFGSILVARSGAHVLDRSVAGSVEFSVGALGASLVLVLGHTNCGAVQATLDAERSGDRPAGDVGYLVSEIAAATEGIDLAAPDAAGLVLRAHVRRTVERLRTADSLAPAIAEGRVDVVGGVYDLATGTVIIL